MTTKKTPNRTHNKIQAKETGPNQNEENDFRCEELQLELASSQRNRTQTTTNSSGQSWSSKGTEIDRIMAKIEQDNRILAELDHSRSTTLGKFQKKNQIVTKKTVKFETK